MQVLIAVPGLETLTANGGVEQSLFRKVSGIPLLSRVIATVGRSGASEIILLHPKHISGEWLRACLHSPSMSSVRVKTIALEQAFDPESPSDWQAIQDQLESTFLWMPWNNVLSTRFVKRLITAGQAYGLGARFGGWESLKRTRFGAEAPEAVGTTDVPVVVVKEKLWGRETHGTEPGAAGVLSRYVAGSTLHVVSLTVSPGVLVWTEQSARRAESDLVRHSGKDWDGFFSRSNRWLCRPAVRWLSKTRVTPNAVTWAGLMVTLFSAYWFAQGNSKAYAMGGLLYFLSVLFDEVDGMLARVTFQDSPFGCLLESFVDYASYVVLYVGITIGLYRQSGMFWLLAGGLTLLGALASFLVISHQRKFVVDEARPQEYLIRYYRRLEEDSGNPISHFVRQTQFLMKKAPFAYWVLIFSLLGALKMFLLLSALGANLTWVLSLHLRRLFQPRPVQPAAEPKEIG